MRLLQECIREKKSFVVDNTNPTVEARQRYLVPLRENGIRIIGYFFDVPIEACLKRNQLRTGQARVPAAALYGTRKKLQTPSHQEGFDLLYSVKLTSEDEFQVEILPRSHQADQTQARNENA